MNKSSTIYVAGHRGLVGSALVRKLKERGYANIIVRSHRELDLTRQSDVEAFFERERPAYVFLAAAKVGGILANNTLKADFIGENIAIALNVINAAHRTGVKKLMNFGSSCIYPRLAPQPLKEEYLLTGPLEPTNEPYAIAKITAVKLCRSFNEQYGTNFLSVMPTNLYGPNDNFNLETSHVLPALVRKFTVAKLLQNQDFDGLMHDIRRFPVGFGLDERIASGDRTAIVSALEGIGIAAQEVTLWGTGEPFREFMHVNDLADASVFLIERYNARDIGEFINIGTGIDLPIREIAALVKEIVGYSGAIRFDTSKPSGTPRKLMDVSRLKNLGWEARLSLREGIQQMLAWYRGEVRSVSPHTANRDTP